MQINVCSIRNKVLELEDLCNEKKINLMCISEHWLQENQVDVFVPNNFIPANVVCRKIRKNGGVGIYILNSIKFSVIDVSQFYSEINFECCAVKLLDKNVIILSIYRSPNGDVDSFLTSFEQTVKKLQKHNQKLIIAGDFNIEMGNSNRSNAVSSRFLNLLRSLNLFPSNNQPTRLNSCIDNVIVNFNRNLYDITLGDHCFSDHVPLMFDMYFASNSKNSKKQPGTCITYVRLHKKENVDLFISSLEKENWPMIDDYIQNKINVQTLFDAFFKQYVDLWHFCSPLIKVSNKNRQVSNKNSKLNNWYTPLLAETKSRMLTLYTIYKNMLRQGSEHCQAAYNVYLQQKRIYRKELLRAKKLAVEQYISNASNSCKAAWKVISNEFSPTHSTAVDLDPDDLNSFFLDSINQLSQGINPSPNNPEELLRDRPENQSFFTWSKIASTDVIKVVSKFSNSNSMDYYWLSNSIVKQTIHIVSEPLAFIFNNCLSEGYFAPSLKISKVIPVFKKGDRNLPQNYRPISIIPIFSKILESLMYNQLSYFFESQNLFSECQHGFRQGKSTTSAVLNLTNLSLNAFERKESVSVVLCDLSKAFDSVPFDILLNKLSFYGIKDSALNIIQSYLCNRRQYVSVRNRCSIMKPVEIGVPQGSVLGPLFFIIYINDLPQNLNVHSIIYADDTTLVASHKNLNCLRQISKEAEDQALSWFSCNKLTSNLEKTQYLTLSLKQEINLDSVKLLGFHIDSKLSWSFHIETVCKKLSRVNYLLWKLKGFVSSEYLRMSYFGLFQSHILYGILVWGHCSHVADMLLIQKNAVRNIAGAESLAHCRPLFIELKIPTVVNLYIFQVLLYTKSNLQLFPIRGDTHEHNTRDGGKLSIIPHRLAKTGNSFKINSIRFFNKLPDSAKFVDFKLFKNRTYNWLIQNPFYSINEFMNCNFDVRF